MRDEPLQFARRALGVDPWQKQIEVLEALRDGDRVTVRACHGVGKTFIAASAALWFLFTRKPAIVLTTAPTERQVRQVLWRQLRALHRNAKWKLGGKLHLTQLDLGEDWFALGLSTNEPDRFQGFHSEHVLLIVDEAAGVHEEIFEAVEGILTTEGAKVLLIGNPTTQSGYFYRSHRSASWQRVHISALESPNVLAGKTVHPKLVTRRWVEGRREDWGESSPVFQSRVLGEFPDVGDRSLFPLRWVEAAQERVLEAAAPCEIGVDLARFGGDESVAYVRRGPVVVAGDYWRSLDLMESAGRIIALIREHGPSAVKVDVIGLGAGVVDRLAEQGQPVIGVNVAHAARDSEQYERLRDEMAFGLRERFRTDDIQIPSKDAKLMAQLTALEYGFTSRGQRRVESKDDMRRRSLPSPDRADALALAFWVPPTPELEPPAEGRGVRPARNANWYGVETPWGPKP